MSGIDRKDESGALMVLAIIVIFVMSAIGLALAQTVFVQYQTSRQQLYTENAVTAAEAGISATIAQLNQNVPVPGYSTEQILYSDADRGRATYSVTVTPIAGSDNKILMSTGKSYRMADGTQLVKTKRIRAVVALQRDDINDSLIFGSGGVYLSQGAGFPKGDVYVRGQLQMERDSFVGSTTQSVNLTLANVGCGTSNWPQPCAASDAPIKRLSTPIGPIYGTVCAKDQPSPTAGIFPGPSGSGLIANCAPRISVAPTFNKKAFIQSMTSASNASNFACSWFGANSRTIPAGTRVNGNLVVPGGCTLYIAGNAYVTGSFTIQPGGVVRVADSVGTTKPTLVVNQGLSFTANAGTVDLFLQNSSGTPMFLITFGSTNTVCSAREDVPSETVQTCLTPAEAKLSATPTPYGGFGTVVANATGAIFYGYYGGMSLSPNVTWQSYAIGVQGMWLGANSRVTTVSDDAPFKDVLFYSTYQMVDYQQLYP